LLFLVYGCASTAAVAKKSSSTSIAESDDAGDSTALVPKDISGELSAFDGVMIGGLCLILLVGAVFFVRRKKRD
jgi:LPXTG-motif cell wall-anchored protein